uniref:MFS18 protein n=1 Tax=Zea mays TaxID=4577 RepID=B6TGW2_MAIZE|nr:MFS18 protein precursor [Zea mays]
MRWCSRRPSRPSTASAAARPPASGGLPGTSSGGSSIPAFSMPGSGSSLPGGSFLPGSSGSIGSMPLFSGGSPAFSGFGGMPGSPAAGSVSVVPVHGSKP